MTSLGFIGVGNMGMALLKGFLGSVSSKNVEIFAYDIDMTKASVLGELGVRFYLSEADVVKASKYVLLSVKPQQVAEVLGRVKDFLTDETVIISICAGISLQSITQLTNSNVKIVQVMPNTPMMIGLGASAITHNDRVSESEFAFARSVIESCGISEIVPPDKMNEIICINGSSPAFIYLFAKCFTEYAEKQGIDGEVALKLFSQTLIGSGKMLGSGMTPDELIAQVSSKGGTTVAGLEVFKSGGLDELVEKACEACTNRAYELGKNNL